jgi:hypothetical protein
MPILMLMEFEGFGAAEYDRVDELLGTVTPQNAPAGLISHTAALTDDGVIVADIWESAEAIQAAFEKDLGPAMAKAGVPQVEPRMLPVHNHLHGSGEQAVVLALVEIDGFTADDYDRLIDDMDAHAGDGDAHPAVSHAVGVSDDGLLVVDVWGSVDEFQEFGQTQLAPRVGAENMSRMSPRFAQVHKHVSVKAPASST